MIKTLLSLILLCLPAVAQTGTVTGIPNVGSYQPASSPFPTITTWNECPPLFTGLPSILMVTDSAGVVPSISATPNFAIYTADTSSGPAPATLACVTSRLDWMVLGTFALNGQVPPLFTNTVHSLLVPNTDTVAILGTPVPHPVTSIASQQYILVIPNIPLFIGTNLWAQGLHSWVNAGVGKWIFDSQAIQLVIGA